MTRPVDVRPEHLERAYAQMRKKDTPPLDVLRDYYTLFVCIRGRALGIAQGQVMPPEPVAAPPPPKPPPAAAHPSPPQRRRHDAHPFDPRAAASGEYVHHLDEAEASGREAK